MAGGMKKCLKEQGITPETIILYTPKQMAWQRENFSKRNEVHPARFRTGK